ncbi:phosphatidylglycerophosphatase A [Silvibacterium dinghuense]|uniref:Phosphatidylglycerophosphatase A n=1 Tax=Silvibacterium dinghuense TaxID=1560006 RepID=A0A4Q1SBQ2_9BACT|nr:phosphatidylglycerophosphatase A [Silvibacterium dinghuense]RXS94455.1 phosphatidylglycerophosphatase A [Silvibacterium dinghuense]
MPQPKVRWGKTTWAWLTATFFGIGLLPGGPGTWASVATVLIWTFSMRALHLAPGAMMLWTAIAAVVVTLIGIPASSIVERESGREDPGHVVIDEVAGQLIALVVSPALWLHAAVALLLFRAFDITKPAPVRQLERLHGGVGIMMDDVAAGGYALLVSLAIHHKW